MSAIHLPAALSPLPTAPLLRALRSCQQGCVVASGDNVFYALLIHIGCVVWCTRYRYRYYEIVRWLLSKLPFYSSRTRTTPTSDNNNNNGGDGLLPDAIKPEAAEVILNAIMLTTGETDRPWSFAKHGEPHTPTTISCNNHSIISYATSALR